MKLSCTDMMVPGTSLEEKAHNLKQWGYDGIALFADYKSWNDSEIDRLKKIESDTGVKVCEFVFIDPLYGHLMDPDPQTRKRARAMYKEAVCVCREFGAITEMEHDYGAQEPLPLFEPYQKMDSVEEKIFIELIQEIAEQAAGSEAQVLIEPINRYETQYLTRISDCIEVLEKADLPNTGILADFFHLSIEEADIPESIRSAKGLIKHVHLGDSNRLLPGYGHTDWEACIKALKDAEFSGYMNLECAILGNPEIELLKTARYLKDIIKRVMKEEA